MGEDIFKRNANSEVIMEGMYYVLMCIKDKHIKQVCLSHHSREQCLSHLSLEVAQSYAQPAILWIIFSIKQIRKSVTFF